MKGGKNIRHGWLSPLYRPLFVESVRFLHYSRAVLICQLEEVFDLDAENPGQLESQHSGGHKDAVFNSVNGLASNTYPARQFFLCPVQPGTMDFQGIVEFIPWHG